MATFYNQATLSYNGNITSSNITTGRIVDVISAEKNAVIDTYTVDNDVVFIISIVNNGNSNFNNVTITDDLGAYTPAPGETEVVPLTYAEGSVTLYINGTQQADPTVTATSPLTITGIDIPANGSVLVIYAVRPNQYAPLGADDSITNTAVISDGSNSGSQSSRQKCNNGFEDITVSETITPKEAADLTISKSLSPTEVEQNGELTYTFIIQNYGNTAATAEDNVIFRDNFDPMLSELTASFNGTAWTASTNYTYNDSTGEFVSNEGQITVPAAEFTQDPDTGAWSVQPGVSTLIITGNI